MTNLLKGAFVLVASVLLFNCKGPAGDVGPVLIGKLTGYVNVYDEYGNRLPDRSGVTVTVDGTGKSAISDAKGKYEIADLSTNTYNIIVSKPSFTNDTIKSVAFVGGNVAAILNVFIGQTPTFKATNLTAGINNGYVQLSAVSSAAASKFPSYYGGFIAYFGNTNNVSNKNYLYSSTLPFSFLAPNPNFTLSTGYNTSDLKTYGFTSGSTAYIVVYPINLRGASYYNPATNSYEYTAIGTPSNVVTVTIP